MRFTSRQDLPCPEGTDMAAVALYMQCMAEQVETTLDAQADEFTSFLNPPVAIWSSTVPQVLSGFLFITFNTVTSNNWPSVPSSTAPSLPNRRGWYYIGANVNITDAPPVLNQDYRVTLTATQNVGIIGDPVLGQFRNTVFESTIAGGENPLVAGTVFFAGGDFTTAAPVDLDLTYQTAIANPVTTTLTPAVRLWVVYLGDTPQIGVI